MEKVAQNFWRLLPFFKKMSKVSKRPRGENLPNLVTLVAADFCIISPVPGLSKKFSPKEAFQKHFIHSFFYSQTRILGGPPSHSIFCSFSPMKFRMQIYICIYMGIFKKNYHSLHSLHIHIYIYTYACMYVYKVTSWGFF
jgi:hypothetical protein